VGCTALCLAVDLGVFVAASEVQMMFGRTANIACCSCLSRRRVARCSRGVSHADRVGVALTWRTRSRVRPSMPPRILRASHHLQAEQGSGFRASKCHSGCHARHYGCATRVACGMSAALPVVCVVGPEHQQQRERKGGQHKGLLQAPVPENQVDCHVTPGTTKSTASSTVAAVAATELHSHGRKAKSLTGTAGTAHTV
jgi:hypothetical protein